MALGSLTADNASRYFVGPFDEGSGNGKAPRGANVSGDYADYRFVLFDANGNGIFVAVDMDTGGGTAYRGAVGLLVAASGGPSLVPGDGTNGLKVQQTASVLPAGGTLVAGTKSLTTTAAAALAASQACKMVMVQNDPDNTVNVLVGDSSSQTIKLLPGDWSPWLPVSNVNLVYAKNVSSTTQSVNWLAIY